MSENLWRMVVAEFGSITGEFLMGEIGTDENFGDRRENSGSGGNRPREHCRIHEYCDNYYSVDLHIKPIW